MASSVLFRYISKIRRIITSRIYVSRAVVEWIFIFVNSFYGSVALPRPLDFLLILVCVCRNLVRQTRIVTISKFLYPLFILYGLDQLSHWAVLLYNAGGVYLVIYIISSIVAATALWKRGVFRLKWYHGAMIGMIGMLFLETGFLIRPPSPSFCRSLRTKPDVRLIIDQHDFPGWYTIPRFFVMDPQETTLFVGYRFPLRLFQTGMVSNYGMIVLDRETRSPKLGKLESWETIGMAFDTQVDNLVAVVVRQSPRPMQPYYACMVWINREGEVINRIPLKHIDRFDYYCVIIPTAEDIRVYDERSFFHIYSRSGSLVSYQKVVGVSAPMTNSLVCGKKLFICYGTTFLHHLLAPGFAVFDLSEFKKLQDTSRFTFGTFAISFDPTKNEVYTNGQWSGTLHVLDTNLNPIREINLGDVVRSIAVDPYRRRGYASLYAQGDLVAFDMDSGKVIGSIEIGKGGRALYVTRRGEVIAGTGCGVVQINPGAFDTSQAE